MGLRSKGRERWVSPELLGGLPRFMSEPVRMICVRFACLHPLWPGFFYFGLVVASLMRYRLLPQWFGVSPPPPLTPTAKWGLKVAGRRSSGGKVGMGDWQSLTIARLEVGGHSPPPTPPPLAASVLWVPRPSLPGVSEALSALSLLLPVLHWFH